MYSNKPFIQYIAMVSSVACLLSACTSNVIDIHPRDSATYTTLETSVAVSSANDTRIKLRTSRVDGSYTQTIPDGKMIVIDNQQIHGEVAVSGASDLAYTSISFGADNLFSDDNETLKGLRASLYLGLAQTSMDVSLVHENVNYAFVDKTVELYLQVAALYMAAPKLDVGVSYAMSLGADLSGISEFELLLDYGLHRHLHLKAGYRWLEYNYLIDSEDSSILVDFRGPFFGLNIPF